MHSDGRSQPPLTNPQFHGARPQTPARWDTCLLTQAPLLAKDWEAETTYLACSRAWFCSCVSRLVWIESNRAKALRVCSSLPACHFTTIARACHAVGNEVKIWVGGKPSAPPLASEMLQVLTEVLTAEMVILPAEAIKGTEKASGFPRALCLTA